MSLFKSAVIYRVGPDWTAPEQTNLEEVLQRNRFVPCGPTEEVSAGWVCPRGEENALFGEWVGGQLILKLMVERKAVPAGAVKAELEARCKKIEAEEGRKPGRKEQREMKEDIVRDLMPRAFSKKSSHFVWVSPDKNLLVVGAGSLKSADAVVTHVVEMMASSDALMPVTPLQPASSPSSSMAHWLSAQEAPYKFSVDRDLELKGSEGEKSAVRYSRHTLEIEEIVNHIKQGKTPTLLAMTWDRRVSFLLTAELTLKKLELLDVVTESEPEAESFEGDVALTTGELSKMIPDLLEALGGESQEAQETTAAN